MLVMMNVEIEWLWEQIKEDQCSSIQMSILLLTPRRSSQRKQASTL
jgi:hypothetical protein